MRKLLIVLSLLLVLPIQAQASPQTWGEDFLQRYRGGKEDTLARLADHRDDIDSELYSELFKVISEDVKYQDYRINFDVFTGSPANVLSLKILNAKSNGDSASLVVETGYTGVRGPTTTKVELLLTKTGPQEYEISDVVYTDWSTPTKLSTLLERIQHPDYTTEPLDLIPDNLKTGRKVVKEQSFLFSEGGLYPLRFVTSTSGGSTPHLELFVHSGDNSVETVELAKTVPTSWRFDQIQALAFGDFNQDGFGPDVLCVASFMSGAGPTAAQPFPVTRIFYRTGYQGLKHSNGDPYKADPKLNKQFDDNEVETVSDALKLIER